MSDGSSDVCSSDLTVAMGNAVYSMPGMNFQGGLDEFWREAEPPDMRLCGRFRNTVINATQVNGGFYTRSGISMAVENSVDRLLAEQSLLETLLQEGA